jgi:hypothetical protein
MAPEYVESKFERFNRRNDAAGRPIRVICDGLAGWGRFHYRPDGFIYKGGCKKPIGRYLKITRVGNGSELALKTGRLDDVHAIEKKRWDMLVRIKTKLLPELRRRNKEVRKYARSLKVKEFNGYVDGQLMKIEVGGRVEDGIDISNAESEELEILDQLGNNFTEVEADRLAKRLRDIKDRVTRGWLAAGHLTALLTKVLDMRLDLNGKSTGAYLVGSFTEVTVNGRVYPTWIGHGGYHRTRNESEHWPSPMHRAVDLDAQLAAATGSPL